MNLILYESEQRTFTKEQMRRLETREKRFLRATAASRSIPLRPIITPASYSMGIRGSYAGLRWPRREADNSPPPSADVKNECSYTSLLQFFIAWCLVKYRDNFNFILRYLIHSNILTSTSRSSESFLMILNYG
jgi:hypothetical protein